MNMLCRKPLLKCIAALAMFISTQALPQTHCKADEINYFSCNIRESSKVASICGGPPLFAQWRLTSESKELPANAWLQYRFGVVGKPEFMFPRSKQNSLKSFEGEHLTFGGAPSYYNYSVYFRSGAASYRITVGHGDSDTHEVVAWTKNKSHSYLCEGPAMEKYFDNPSHLPFSELTALLATLNPAQ